MQFTENQKAIFKQIKLANHPLTLEQLLKKHFHSKSVIVEPQHEHDTYITIHDTMKLNMYDEVKDIIHIWLYVQEHNLVYYDNKKVPLQYSREVFFKKDLQTIEQPDLTMLLEPFWTSTIIPTFTLNEFIENGHKTKDDIKAEEEKEEKRKEKESRTTSQRWTIGLSIGGVVVSIIVQVILYNNQRIVHIDNPRDFSDTVKVMYLEPQIQTPVLTSDTTKEFKKKL